MLAKSMDRSWAADPSDLPTVCDPVQRREKAQSSPVRRVRATIGQSLRRTEMVGMLLVGDQDFWVRRQGLFLTFIH